MGLFRRKRTQPSPAVNRAEGSRPDHAATALDSGSRTLAQELGAALRLDEETQEQLAAELRRWASAAWELQRSAMSATATDGPAGTQDAKALVVAAQTLFNGQNIPGLTGDLGPLQRSAVFTTLLVLGLAEPVEGSDELVVRPAAGGIVIAETLHGLDHGLSQDEPARVAFAAAADAVMWGAAVAIAETQLKAPPGGARPVTTADVLVVADDDARVTSLPGTAARHVLSFEEFDNASTFQSAVFEQVPAVTELHMTNPQAQHLQSLVNASGAAVDPSTFGRHVIVAQGPTSVSDELEQLALAHAGVYECQTYC